LNYDEINKTSLCVIQSLQNKVDILEHSNIELVQQLKSEKNKIIILENRMKNIELLMEEIKDKLKI
jgi:hypothetical protein